MEVGRDIYSASRVCVANDTAGSHRKSWPVLNPSTGFFIRLCQNTQQRAVAIAALARRQLAAGSGIISVCTWFSYEKTDLPWR
jgi:hypothetical protein